MQFHEKVDMIIRAVDGESRSMQLADDSPKVGE
jgi:hypothetical protein